MADTQNTNVQEQDIHQLLKVKREKLANLQQAGKDPFQITKYDVPITAPISRIISKNWKARPSVSPDV